MQALSGNLPCEFRTKDTQFGVARSTVTAIAKELGPNKTWVIYMALSKFAVDVLPSYPADDDSPIAKQLLALHKDTEKLLPKGGLVSREALFA